MWTVGGGAFGEFVDVELPIVTVTSGPLPEVTLPADGGGPFTNSLASVTVPGDGSILTTGLLEVSTEGGNLGTHSGFATSSAEVNEVDILSGLITADVITSECTSNGDGSVGSTTIVNGQIPLLDLTPADVGILTSDNPRTESPELIFADVLSGRDATSLFVEPDRRRAIALAVEIARSGDTILIAGKGDQTVQQIGPTAMPFDDRIVAREEIAATFESGSACIETGATIRPALTSIPISTYGPERTTWFGRERT